MMSDAAAEEEEAAAEEEEALNKEEAALRDLLEEDPELVDPEGEVFSSRRRWSALVHFVLCWLFLVILNMAVFSAPYGEHLYHQTAAVKNALTQNEIFVGSNVFLADTWKAEDVYDMLREVLLPAIYEETYYDSGKRISEESRTLGGGWTRETLLTLGRVRLRQIRVEGGRQCRVQSFVDEAYEAALGGGGGENSSVFLSYDDAECFGPYAAEIVERGTWDLSAARSVKYRGYSDGYEWDSPYSNKWYGGGGFAVDLPLGLGGATAEVDRLEGFGFLDPQTRIVFVDTSFYNANVAMFTSLRVAFEFLETGKMQATLEVDSAPLSYDKDALQASARSRFNLVCELVLYAVVVVFVLKVIEDVARYGSMVAYMSEGWNAMEVVAIASFFIALLLRVIYNFRVLFKSDVGSYEDNIQENDEFTSGVDYGFDTYVRIRLSFTVYRVYRSLFAFGILTSFLKSLRLLTIFRKLSLFTETVYRVSMEMLGMFLVLVIILVGFGIATHLSFGTALYEYHTVGAAMWTLTLVVFGQMDFDRVVAIAPTAGLVLLLAYNVIMSFVVLSMFIKIVDVSFVKVEAQLFAHDDSEYVREIRSAIRHVAHDLYWRAKLEVTLLRVRYANHRLQRKMQRSLKHQAAAHRGGAPDPDDVERPAGGGETQDLEGASSSSQYALSPSQARRTMRNAVVTSTMNSIELTLEKRRELSLEAKRPFEETAERRRIIAKMLRDGKAIKDADLKEFDVADSALFYDKRQDELLGLYVELGEPQPHVRDDASGRPRRNRATRENPKVYFTPGSTPTHATTTTTTTNNNNNNNPRPP